MTGITVAWSMMASACLTLALIHLLIWFKQRGQYAHLLYATFAVAVAVYQRITRPPSMQDNDRKNDLDAGQAVTAPPRQAVARYSNG